MSKRTPLIMQAIQKDIDQMKPFEIEPPDQYKTGKAKRYYEKQCHKKAWDYMVYSNHEEGVMVQGLHSDMGVPHSWVELPDDIVFDGVLQRFYNKDDYYRERQIIKIVEFTLKEILQKYEETGNIGEWFDFSEIARSRG